MIKSHKAIIATLTATVLLTSGVAWAADQQKTAAPDQQKATPQQTTADKDFGKLSADGASAYQDMTLTRIAIFEGRIDDAKKYVDMADTSFGKAKIDDTVYTKAESELNPPAGKDASANKNVAAAAPADNKQADQMKKPISWLPVDGSITIGEDYTASPAKKTAVADANKSLKSGDRKGAIEKLKLADVNVDVVLAVMPLEQTIDKVHQATSLINGGKYYEASQELKQAQDGLRFDATDNGVPQTH